MKHWRTVLVAALLLVPVALLLVVGTWSLWQTGLLVWTWWVLPVCWGVAWLLARRWRDRVTPLPPLQSGPPLPRTPKDDEAWQLVEARAQNVSDVPPQSLTDPRFYFDTALELSLEIARHYHPKAEDPVTSLSVAEILAAAHLAIEDLEDWFRRYVPAGHWLTVRQWRTLSRAPDWFRRVRNVSWAVAMIWNPTNIGRYIASRFTTQPLSAQLQSNILAAFYVCFVRAVGFYSVEMNSGRLRGGAEKYRAAMEKMRGAGRLPPAAAETEGNRVPRPARGADEGPVSESEEERRQAPEPLEITVSAIGRDGSGKSSLISALLGERAGAAGVKRLAKDVRQFLLRLPDTSDRLVLLDTDGYGEAKPSRRRTKALKETFQRSDLVLLLCSAQHPDHSAERELLEQVGHWYREQSRLRLPPVLGVLTHVDVLDPPDEWHPPYDWQQPSRPKEHSIREAVDRMQREFGGLLAGVVPVCADVAGGRSYGIQEWVLPAMTALLGEARSCAMVRALHGELDVSNVRTLFQQLRNAGSGLLSTFVSSR